MEEDREPTLVPVDEPSRRALEEEADRLIHESVADLKASDKADVLTAWKQRDRWKKELFIGGDSRHGAAAGLTESYGPDKSIRLGMLHRAYNPVQVWLNSRDRAHSDAYRPRGPVVGHRTTLLSTGGYNHPSWRHDDGKVHPVSVRYLPGYGPP